MNHEADRVLDEALRRALPRPKAPDALKARLAATWPTRAPAPRSRDRFVWAALAFVALLLVAAVSAIATRRIGARDALANEAVNDHLRVLEGAPLAQVTGGLHEVKPWFAGKLDFAPAVQFAGDADFPLEGGAVERFLDRKAAVFVFHRRLHRISLFVMRSEGLALPLAPPRVTSVRGFSVVSFREHEEAFVLVSDLNAPELLDLQRRIAMASGD